MKKKNMFDSAMKNVKQNATEQTEKNVKMAVNLTGKN